MSRRPVAWETARGVRVLVAVAQGAVALAVVALVAPVQGARFVAVAGVLAGGENNARIPLPEHQGLLGRSGDQLHPYLGKPLKFL